MHTCRQRSLEDIVTTSCFKRLRHRTATTNIVDFLFGISGVPSINNILFVLHLISIFAFC
jgi:hypothetical protein